MSFILDALKKAEAERNRRIAPVLMDARIAPPRRGLPAWAWALGVALLVNLALLAWLLLREPAPVVVAAAPAEAPALPAATPATPAATAPALPTQAPPAAPLQGAVQPALPAPTNTSGTSVVPETLPSFQELRAAGVALPELQLNLHVYDPAPAYRSVMLNGNRVREGEYTPDGVKVERITPVGVVLEAAGRRFRLEAGS